MDQKGRVSLPSAFRRDADESRFVLLKWEDGYLTLFTEQRWDQVQRNLLDFRRSNPEGWNQVRVIIANAVEVVPDKQGRILVPALLKDAAGLSGTVLLCGNLDRIELWDPETYRAQVEEPAGDLDDVAHKLFG